ncbi:insulin-degrading enzyme isoform X2 [Prorops nasuta]
MTSLQQNDESVQIEGSSAEQESTTAKTFSIDKKLNQNIEKKYNDIPKSPNDKRSYRGLLLCNKMKVLLISDPTTDKSASALSVNVGYMSDPIELPGLAHFCEHMLFLGTSKYPNNNDYNMYLSQNGGSSNASTYTDHTMFYFDVTPDKLSGALDRFSQFFLTPLFTEALTELELNAVNSEHEKNLANDTWRINQLEKSSCNLSHPYSKFGTGSKATLDTIPKQNSINVREKLLEFHHKYYSANIMSLCILGKETLDELEEMVVDKFQDVENKEIEAPKWSDHPFTEEHFQTKWLIVPIKDIRNLTISFPLPDLHGYYRSSPAKYVSHLIGHEGEGSLLSTLKANGWCNSLVAGSRSGARGFYFYTVQVDLTEEGIKHVDDIITIMFEYINMLKKEGPVEWIYKECRDILAMNFRFKEKISPRKYVSLLVQALQDYPIEEVLTAQNLIPEWRPNLINWVMDYLTPRNIRVGVLAKCYESVADETEYWYGTRFKKEKIPKEVIEKWENPTSKSDFKLPEKNEFIPTRFDIKPCDPNADKFPVIIEDNLFVRLWFKQDDEFLVPKANITFQFVSPVVYMDPISCNLSKLFVRLFQDALNEYSYEADLAGLKWLLSDSKYGMVLSIGGYDDKQRVLLEKILDRMIHFTVDPERFVILKDEYIRDLKNYDADQPYQHAVYYLEALLSETIWLQDEMLEACSHLTADKVQDFIPQIFNKCHIEGLIHGNVTSSEALDIIKLVESKLKNSFKVDLIPLLPRQLVLNRVIKLDEGSNFVYETENKLHKSSCTEIYYQSGLQSTKSNMLLELLAQIISEPCFNILRTQEQLGYIVFSGVRRTGGSQGLRVIVQSDKHPQYLESRVNAFLNIMLERITNITDEEFEKQKDSLAVQRLEKPKMLISKSTRFWNEIVHQQYNFDRANIEVAYLKTITKKKLLQFFKDICFSNLRSKISVHVVSMAPDGAGLVAPEIEKQVCPANESMKKIDDMVSFKISQSLYPLLKPFKDIPRKGVRSSKL